LHAEEPIAEKKSPGQSEQEELPTVSLMDPTAQSAQNDIPPPENFPTGQSEQLELPS